MSSAILMGVMFTAAAGLYGGLGRNTVKQSALSMATQGREVIKNNFRQIFNAPNFLVAQAERDENIWLNRCIMANDADQGGPIPENTHINNCATVAFDPPGENNVTPGRGINIRMGNRFVSRNSFPGGTPYSYTGSQFTPSGRFCSVASPSCPWLVTTTFKALCGANAAVCDQAKTIEFSVFIRPALAGDGKPFVIPAMGGRLPLPNEPFRFEVEVVDLFRSRTAKCPPGHAQRGRDQRGALICDHRCMKGFEWTGNDFQWTGGGTTATELENPIRMRECRAIKPECAEGYEFRGFDPVTGTQVCQKECSGEISKDSFKVGEQGHCADLNNTRASCPNNTVMAGILPNGFPECKPLSLGSCSIRPAASGCLQGEFLSKFDENNCKISCRNVCTNKGVCRAVCAPACETGEAQVRCCLTVR